MPHRERKRLLVTLATFAVLLAVGLAYTPARSARFVGDDHVVLGDQARWRWVPPTALFTGHVWPYNPQSEVRTAYYRPITLASLALDNALGDTPVEYHFTNVALHLAACALLAVLAMRLGASGIAGVLAALAWGLAPRLTEAVAWASGRADVLAGTLSLAALACAPDVSPFPSPPRRRRAWLASAASGALLLAAALAKETAVAAAAAIVVAACVPRAGEPRPARLERLARLVPAVVVPALAYALLRARALEGAAGSIHRELGPGARVLTALEAIGRYVVLALDAFRPRASIGMLGEIAWPFVVLAVVVLLAAALAARRVALDVGLLVPVTLGASALVPVLHLAPFSIAGAVVADRYLYLPLAGLALALAVVASRLRERFAWIAGVAAVLLAFPEAIATRDRAAAYADEVRFLVEAAETAHPHNTAQRSALAALVMDWGPVPLACSVYDRVGAIQRESGYAGSTRHRRTRENLALCLARAGRDDDARAILEDVIRAQPREARAYDVLAVVDLHALRFDEAVKNAERAVELDPSLGELVARHLVELPEARREATELATAEARAADPVGYARMLRHANRNPEAVAAWLAVARDPATGDAARQEALLDLFRFAPPPDAMSVAPLGPPLPPRLAVPFRLRLRHWEQVERLRDRIERLAGPGR